MDSQTNRVENIDPDAWQKQTYGRIALEKEADAKQEANQSAALQNAEVKGAAVSGAVREWHRIDSVLKTGAEREASIRNVVPPSPRMQKNVDVKLAAQTSPAPSVPAPAPTRTHGPSR